MVSFGCMSMENYFKNIFKSKIGVRNILFCLYKEHLNKFIFVIMKRILSLFLASSLFLVSCSSYTAIETNPPGAKVYVNQAYIGKSPVVYRDSKIVGSSQTIKIEHPGYEPLYAPLSRTEKPMAGPIIAGFFTGGIAFLWGLGYDEYRTFELVPEGYYQQEEAAPLPPLRPKPTPTENTTLPTPQNPTSPSTQEPVIFTKASKLRELKKLLDEGIITQAEFDAEKKKILAQP
jgi:hypothetical protein